MVWTLFWDMHSGGGLKEEPYQYIFIESCYKDAVDYFEERFGHCPTDVACECCGENYNIDESDTLEQSSGYHRGGEYIYFNKKDEVISQQEGFTVGKGITEGCSSRYIGGESIEDFSKREDILIIYKDEIDAISELNAEDKEKWVMTIL